MSISETGIFKVIREELLVIIFVLLFILTINYTVFLAYGWVGLMPDPPAFENSPQAIRLLGVLPDSDNDGLPDVIELAPKGSEVWIKDDLSVSPGPAKDAVLVGHGTGTNPFSKDTDYDLFPDLAEDKLGSDSNTWIDGGWFWIVWGVFLASVVYFRYIRKVDRVKEYELRESLIQEGATAGGKYGFGSSIFASKKYDEMSAEEREQAVLEDARFHELTGFEDLPSRGKPRRNPAGKIFQIFVAMFIVIIIFVAFFA